MSLQKDISYFDDMVDIAYDYAEAHINAGKPMVGIMCEFTPRELMRAAGALTVCLCGGSPDTIPPAETVLPSNLCPLIKSTFGYHITGQNPFLEWASLIVAETTCDGKKKMYEIMSESREMHVLELPQKVDDPDAMQHWVSELRKLKSKLETKYGVEITDEKLREAIRAGNHERNLRRNLAELMKRDTPPYSGYDLLSMCSLISNIPSDLEQYEKIYNAALSLPDEPRTIRSPVRVMLTGVPTPHGTNRLMELIESLGATVVVIENCSGIKPLVDNIDETHPDPLEAIAQKYFHLPCSVMTPNTRRETLISQLTQDYRVEAIVDLAWHACITYEVESYNIKKLADEKLDVPYLKVVTDYSPADNERIKVRLEAMFEMARERRL